MFSLGIGKDVDISELNKVASGPDNVFSVDSFEDLDDKVKEIKRGLCIGIFHNALVSFNFISILFNLNHIYFPILFF